MPHQDSVSRRRSSDCLCLCVGVRPWVSRMLQALIGAEQGFFSSILSIGPVGRSARDEYAGALFIVHLSLSTLLS